MVEAVKKAKEVGINLSHTRKEFLNPYSHCWTRLRAASSYSRQIVACIRSPEDGEGAKTSVGR